VRARNKEKQTAKFIVMRALVLFITLSPHLRSL
jgi:hypothetical protein